MKHLTPKRRRYLYRVAAAVLAVLVAHGLIDGDLANTYLSLFAALFLVADANVTDDAE